MDHMKLIQLFSSLRNWSMLINYTKCKGFCLNSIKLQARTQLKCWIILNWSIGRILWSFCTS
jgi:hypothetical protein